MTARSALVASRSLARFILLVSFLRSLLADDAFYRVAFPVPAVPSFQGTHPLALCSLCSV